MQSTPSLDIAPRKTIEGRVMIMRKTMWSARYAVIKDAVFSYKKEKSDQSARQIIDLRKSKISKGVRTSGEPFFIISKDALEIKVRPETIVDYKRWALVLSESMQSDEVYR